MLCYLYPLAGIWLDWFCILAAVDNVAVNMEVHLVSLGCGIYFLCVDALKWDSNTSGSTLMLLLFIILFLRCIIITSPSFVSLQTLPQTPPCCFSKSRPLLSLLLCAYMFLSVTCSVCIMLQVCVFSRLIIWCWVTNWWEDYFSFSEHSLNACRV